MQLSWSSTPKQLRSTNRWDAHLPPASLRLYLQTYCHSFFFFFFFKVGTYAMDSTLLKYSAKDHFFKAALCHFCVDMLNAKVSHSTNWLQRPWVEPQPLTSVLLSRCQLAVQKYEEMFPAFSDSRECKLLKVSIILLFDRGVQIRWDWTLLIPQKGNPLVTTGSKHFCKYTQYTVWTQNNTNENKIRQVQRWAN